MTNKIIYNPIIRMASTDDASIIADFHIRGWQTAYKHILPIEKLNTLSLSEWEEMWKVRLKNTGSFVFILENKNIPCGFIAFGPNRDEFKHSAHTGEIYAVYLDPNMKGKGYGKLLCQAACEQLQQEGFSIAVLWTLEENYHAQQFYEIIGFTKTLEFKNVEILDMLFREIQYQKILKK